MTEYAKKQPSETKRSAATQTIAKKIEEAGRRDNQPPVQAYSGIEENYAEEINIPLEIFRAYDIRGVFEQSLTIEITEMIGKAIGSEVIDQGEQQVVVAADGRLSSPALKEALINGLTSTGCNVIDIGVTPTPVLYFALHHLGHRSGVMITGSHNPVEYNGLKIVIDGITIAEDRIQALYHRVLQDDHVTGNGRHESILVNDHYMDRVCNDVALIADPLKLVVDCGNGVAGSVAPGMLRALGCEVTELYCEVDGNFPNHAPDPSKSENLQDLISSVTSMNADLGLAFDGDGDRLIAVSGSGKIIQPDRLMMLFARDIVSRNPGADVVFDVKSSKHLAEVISEAGGRPVMWKSGHSLMKAKSDELGALLAGEFSGHLFFRERWYGFDDGIYTAARLLEVLSTEGLTLDELMSEFPWSPNTPELDIDIPDDKKFVFVERFREAANFEGGSQTDLDGVRVDFPDGWGLVRASNTMPKLTARFEADDEAALERIQDLFRQQLQAIDAEITIPF
ncbi:MAG: phosphomannomutase/phosphoglucomutase [Pseudomonadales bacterium]|nr:phosphomannomutase/phosphoglucomutase [Pseudomonadales bacterium]